MSSLNDDNNNNNITHDHIYLSNSVVEKDCNQAKHSPSNTSNSSDIHRRIIRKKCDIQSTEDREAYVRRRTLNNASCRVSRIHRRSKSNFIIQKCTQYEGLNTKLQLHKSILTEVINRLKEHLRTLVPTNLSQN